MPPKPFPLLFSIGVDICSVDRIEALLLTKNRRQLRQWGSKVFSRLEWPLFALRCAAVPQDHNSVAFRGLALWLAGRWAAKEAAVKAHRSRKLVMRDISIFPIYAVNKSNPKAMSSVALIDPPRRPVRMNPDVAVTRGLREVYNLLRIENTWSDDVTHSATITGQGESLTKEVFWRNLLVKEKDRQIAEISISHDAGCAVAVCLAANTVHSYLDELKPVVDDGKGPPMHEPEMDDAGYWEVNDMVKEVWARKGQEILVEDPLQKESVVEKPE